MIEPNIKSGEAGQTSEITGITGTGPRPGVCIKTAKKSLSLLDLGDWALMSNNLL